MAKDNQKDIFWISLMSAFVTSICLLAYFYKDEPRKTSIKKGVFQKYSEINSTKGSDWNLIYLKNKSYNIPNIHYASFNKKLFLDKVKQGDSIILTIEGNNIIHQIQKSTLKFIDSQQKISLIEDNNNLALILGIVFFGIFIFLQIYGRTIN
ncbi:hypothetical protein MHTCC0001_16290 [Flavobacteriaceae bacterium MHTCC 0001]